jgi:hypothetical protein
MTIVRMKVAKSGLTLSTPTLAKIAVIAAKMAESAAQNCQVVSAPFIWSLVEARLRPLRRYTGGARPDEVRGVHKSRDFGGRLQRASMESRGWPGQPPDQVRGRP